MLNQPPVVIAYRNPVEAWLWESGIMWTLLPVFGLVALMVFGWVIWNWIQVGRRMREMRSRRPNPLPPLRTPGRRFKL